MLASPKRIHKTGYINSFVKTLEENLWKNDLEIYLQGELGTLPPICVEVAFLELGVHRYLQIFVQCYVLSIPISSQVFCGQVVLEPHPKNPDPSLE